MRTVQVLHKAHPVASKTHLDALHHQYTVATGSNAVNPAIIDNPVDGKAAPKTWPDFAEAEVKNFDATKTGPFMNMSMPSVVKQRFLYIYGNFTFTTAVAFAGIQIALRLIQGKNIAYTVPFILTNEANYPNQGESFLSQSRACAVIGGTIATPKAIQVYLSKAFGTELNNNPVILMPKLITHPFESITAEIISSVNVSNTTNRFYIAVDTCEV